MLRRYLTGLFLTRFLGSLLGLSAILQLLDLLDKTGEILTRGGIADIGRFIGLRLPTLLGEMIPLAALLGALLTFMRLAAALEMTAMRAAGLSLWQVLRALLPACLLVSVLQFTLQTEVSPRSERAFADWWARTEPPAAADMVPPPRLWLRARGDVAAIDHVSLDGRRLDGLLIVQRTADGDLDARLDARNASYRDGRWTLHDVRIDRPTRVDAELRPSLDWPHGPPPANMVELAQPVDTQTLGRLIATLRGRWVGAHGPAYYWTQVEELLASLFDPLLMVLLTVPVLLAPPRAGNGAGRIAKGLTLGLGYLVLSGLLGAMGNAGTLPPVMAAWTAMLLFGVYCNIKLLQIE